ncbi:hypothetical protein [Alkalicoccus luteus]|uniref:Uncharacterized protein n=1 Tax=Alkalicoccus luteus TaxID=1237094 RepID=A0A969PUH8_9BACI|nr:hypothetical protein [Alkalicoccus luteus]NJP39374.1 hypothetical protein [Alkalicoccus luteus]
MARIKTIEEEIQKIDKNIFFGNNSPKPTENGKVILDPNNPSDVRWYSRAEDYDVV